MFGQFYGHIVKSSKMKMLRVFTTVVAVLMVGGMVLNAQTTTLLTLEDALKIALSESETVRIADKEV